MVTTEHTEHISEPDPGMADPPHLRDEDAPCAWCGAVWVADPDTATGAMSMDHQPGCAYISAGEADDA